MPYDIDTATRTVDLDDGLHITHLMAGQPGSPQAFQSAFDFLQRNAEGRYSDRSLMSVGRWSFRSTELLSQEDRPEVFPSPRPFVFSINREVSYDEETEVKLGGTAAVAVTLPAEWGSKLVMAVHPDMRRTGQGRRLLNYAADYISGLHAWVGNSNVVGQQFLLALGLIPVSMNSRRSMLFSYGDVPEDDGVAR